MLSSTVSQWRTVDRLWGPWSAERHATHIGLAKRSQRASAARSGAPCRSRVEGRDRRHPVSMLYLGRILTDRNSDRIHERICVKFGVSPQELSLAQVLEAATWKGGREIAKVRREGGPREHQYVGRKDHAERRWLQSTLSATGRCFEIHHLRYTCECASMPSIQSIWMASVREDNLCMGLGLWKDGGRTDPSSSITGQS